MHERQKQILTRGAELGVLPTNVGCRVGCKFCYEKFVKKDFSDLDFHGVPRYSEEAFDFFMSRAPTDGPIIPDSVYSVDGGVHMGPNADFFTLGLTDSQIRTIVSRANPDEPLYLYTTGLGADPALIADLSRAHPRHFVLRLSAITFDDGLKRCVVTHPTLRNELVPLIQAAHVPRVMLMCFTKEQLLDDLAFLNSLCPGGCRVLVSMIQYTDVYPDDMRELADISHREFPGVVRSLMLGRPALPNVTELRFLFPPEAMAWKHRNRLRALMPRHDDSLVLTSEAARRVIQLIVGDTGTVRSVQNPSGGSFSFATTLTASALLEEIEAVRSRGARVRKVIAPASIWWLQGDHDFEGNAMSDFAAAASAEFVPVKIPGFVLDCNLTLAECADYYSAPAQRALASRDFPPLCYTGAESDLGA